MTAPSTNDLPHSGGRAGDDALADYDFDLPKDRIAQQPLAERDASRLLCLGRASGALRHESIGALPGLLGSRDLLVVNATRVLAARLVGCRTTGGSAEALLLGSEPGGSPGSGARFRALLRISGRLRTGIELRFGEPALRAEVSDVHAGGQVTLQFPEGSDPYAVGRPPLPPYIERSLSLRARAQEDPRLDDRERYQTVFARVPGAVAAPTAGLHLSEALLDRLAAQGVRRAEVVLHVGLGTFRPLRPEDLKSGRLHPERFELPAATAHAIDETRAHGGRVVAVGTTTTRVLESRADGSGGVRPGEGETDLFIRPGHRFQAVDALLTNFHLPRSSLLMLVAAFAGKEHVLSAYRTAVARGYRFFSYGDAMWIA